MTIRAVTRRSRSGLFVENSNSSSGEMMILPAAVEDNKNKLTTNTDHSSSMSSTTTQPADGGGVEILQQQQQNRAATAAPSWFVIQVTLIASLGGILFGYDLGVISGALPQLQVAFDLSPQQQEWVVSVLYIGGGLGACWGGALCDAAGRKRAILYTDCVFLCGAVLLATAQHVAMLVAGRILVGFGVAVSGIADVSYLHEMAPVQYRGAMVSVNEAAISAGFLIAFGVGSVLANQAGGWRIMFGLSGVMALMQLMGMWNMPESPKWLYEQGRIEESEAAMQRIQQGTTVTVMPQRRRGGGRRPGDSQSDGLWIELEQQNSGSDHHISTNTSGSLNKNLSEHSTSGNSSSMNTPGTSMPSQRRTSAVLPPQQPSITHPQDYQATHPISHRNSNHESATSGSSTDKTRSAAVASENLFVALPQHQQQSQQEQSSPHSSSPTSDATFTSGVARFLFLVLPVSSWIQVQYQKVVYTGQQLTKFVTTVRAHHAKQAMICLFLAVAQQLSGQTNVLSYAPSIFSSAASHDNKNDSASPSDSSSTNAWATVSMGLVKFAVTLLVIWKIEQLGRRFLLLSGMATVCLGLLLLTIAFGASGAAAAATDGSSSATTSRHAAATWALVGVLLVVCGYSMSFGPLTWLLTSELFPTDIRGRALGFSTIVTYVMAWAVTYTFLSAQEWLGPSKVFMFYFIVSSLGWIFAYLAIPDTGGKSVAEIEQDLEEMYWWRTTAAAKGRAVLVTATDDDNNNDNNKEASSVSPLFQRRSVRLDENSSKTTAAAVMMMAAAMDQTPSSEFRLEEGQQHQPKLT